MFCYRAESDDKSPLTIACVRVITHAGVMYRIAGNIDGKSNLVDWHFWKQTVELKSAIV